METERMTLSQQERDRLKVLHEVKQGQLTQVAAARRLQLSDRQVRRRPRRIEKYGDQAVIHGLRGMRLSNREFAACFEQKVLKKRLGQRYADFGPTLAAEHLAKEGLPVSRRDPAEVDDQSCLLASALPAREADPRVARAKSQFWKSW